MDAKEVTMRIHTAPSLFDRFIDEALATAPVARPFRPALDLIEYPDRYEVVADLPGVDQKEVEVEFVEGVLHVRGERAGDTLSDEARAFRRERAAGKFARSIAFRHRRGRDRRILPRRCTSRECAEERAEQAATDTGHGELAIAIGL
jgi:HSP20 family molecular chaperone IbpA